MRRLVIVRYRKADCEWFVGEKDERLSAIVGQPFPDASSEALAIWKTREEACRYAQALTDLHRKHPERLLAECRARAREIVWHG